MSTSTAFGIDFSEAENMPSPPGVVLEILRLANDPTKTASDLASIIQQDPVLAAKLLKIVNSAAYGLRNGAIDDIGRAVALLGFRPVRLLAMACSTSDTMADNPTPAEFDIEGFWIRSVIAAASGRIVAGQWAHALGETAFVTGLLARLGRLVLVRCEPERYLELLRRSPWPRPEEEIEHLGFTNAQIGGALLQHWGLPEHVVRAVASQHDPNHPPEGLGLTLEEGETAGVLNRAVAFSTLVSDSARAGSATIDDVFAAGERWLELTPVRTSEMLERIQKEVNEVGSLVLGGLPNGVTSDSIMNEARATIGRLLAANRSRSGLKAFANQN
jgi:HD-like signal output (HDOD) protein